MSSRGVLSLQSALAALVVLGGLAGCGERAPSPSDPGKGGPSSAPATAASEPGLACESDADCVGDWNPSVPRCVPPDRCVEGHCGAPPAITGAANSQTGTIVFTTPTGERTFHIELAQASFETQRGLMCRDSMQRDWGMLFFMNEARVHSFWMFNTLIPLDIMFIDAEWNVVGVAANAEPLTRTPRNVNGVSSYVLELVSGMAAEAGIGPGTKARYYAPRHVE